MLYGLNLRFLLLFDDLIKVFCFFQEVSRIRNEHPDDACAVINDRVKGSLKVTRAFGAGFLKQVVIFMGIFLCFLCENPSDIYLIKIKASFRYRANLYLFCI